MTAAQSILLGIVEGLTEYLPVSSTGHLLLAKAALGLNGDPAAQAAIDAYLIVIQIGAILAVVSLYFPRLWSMFMGLLGRDKTGLRLLINVVLAFLPAASAALLFEDTIKSLLFGLWPVCAAWFVGGLALVVFGHRSRDREGEPGHTLDDLTPRRALLVGLFQVLALWPGTSRSLVTILGARVAGLTLKDSVLFSFLLGVMTLGAATAYDLLKHGREILDQVGGGNLLLGTLCAGLSAWAAVRGMIGYLKRHGLAAFGFYRIAIALVTAGLLLAGVLTP